MSEPPRLGIDVGGTRLKLALIDRPRPGQVRIVARQLVALQSADRSAAGLIDCLRRAIATMTRAHPTALGGVGMGVAGVLDAAAGTVLDSPNLPWLNGFAIAAALSAALDLPVQVDNDVNCIGWGEATAGAGAGVPNLLCLALGTGVGGGLILDGQLVRGQRGRGAEFGHICVDPRGPPCGCGGRGCLEQYASQTGLLRLMEAYGLRPAVESKLAIPALFALAAKGDVSGQAVVLRAGRALGQGIAGLLRLFDVPLVVICGGIAGALDDLRPGITQALAAHAPARLWQDVAIVAGTLGADAGCVGAAALADGGASSSCRKSSDS